MTNISQPGIKPLPYPYSARILAGDCNVAHRAARDSGRFPRREACALEVLLLLVTMKLDLGANIGVHLSLSSEMAKTAKEGIHHPSAIDGKRSGRSC